MDEQRNLENEFKYLEYDKLNILSRKNVFCYGYVDNMEEFKITHLPPIKDFYISEQDYAHT